MKRWLSGILAIMMCCVLVPQSASAQTRTTEELLGALAEYLFSGAPTGIEVQVDEPGFGQSTFRYATEGAHGPSLSLETPGEYFGLDAEGAYIKTDGEIAGFRLEELTPYWLQGATGLSRLPRFSAEDGALAGELLEEIFAAVMDEAVWFEVIYDEENVGAGSAQLEIDVDQAVDALNNAFEQILKTRATDVDALLKEYGEALGLLIPGFPQSVGGLKLTLGMLNLAGFQTGMKVSVAVDWTMDTWRAEGDVLGWLTDISWQDGEFMAVVSPGDMLPDGLPVFTLDSRDLEKVLYIVYGLYREIPQDALSFMAGFGSTSFRLDTVRLREFVNLKAPAYLKSYESEIDALAERYAPILGMLPIPYDFRSDWSNVDHLTRWLEHLVYSLPEFTAGVDLTNTAYYGNGIGWKATATLNDHMLTLSGDRENVTALLHIREDYTGRSFSTYTLDGRLNGQGGGELVLGVNRNGQTEQLTFRCEAEEDGYRIEAYTKKDEFFAVLRIGSADAELEVLAGGETVVTGSARIAGNYLYVDLLSDGLTLDGTLVVDGEGFTMTLLVNGEPVTAEFRSIRYWGWMLGFHSDRFDLEAEWYDYSSGGRLYAKTDSDGYGRGNRGRTLLVEALPYEERYGFVVTDNDNDVLLRREYGFTYAPGRFSIMNGTMNWTLSDVTAWAEDGQNVTDVTVSEGWMGYMQSYRIVSRIESDAVLKSEVYSDWSEEAVMTVTIDLEPGQAELPEPGRWLTAEELLSLFDAGEESEAIPDEQAAGE